MNIIDKDIKQLDSIANAYNKTEGEMKKMWKEKHPWERSVIHSCNCGKPTL